MNSYYVYRVELSYRPSNYKLYGDLVITQLVDVPKFAIILALVVASQLALAYAISEVDAQSNG